MNYERINKQNLGKIFLNFSFRSIANLVSKALGLITLPIITRALGPEGYGNYNLVNLIAQYTFLPVALLGLRIYGIREIAGEKKQNSYATNILSMQFTVAVIAVFVSTIITFIIFRSNSFSFISIIIGYLIVFANTFDLEFFYVAKKALVFPTITRLIGQVFYIVGVILFIKSPDDLPILVFLAALTPAIADFIQLRKFNSKYEKIKLRLAINEAFSTLKITYKLGISTNLEAFYPSIPQLLLPILLGSYALGIFTGGYIIYSFLVMFYVTLFYALAPYLVKLNSHTIKVRRKYHLLMFLIIIFFSGIIGLGLYSFGEPLLILILGKSFGESGIVFKTISLTLIPLAPINMLFGNILIFSGNDKYYLYSIIVSSISIIISAPILIINYNVVGSVYAIAISMFIGMLLTIYFYFKSKS